MRKLAYSTFALILAASAAQAQSTDATSTGATLGADVHGAAHAEAAAPALPAEPTVSTDAAGDVSAPVAATPAEPAAEPALPAVTAAAVTEAEIESFAQATVKLQSIESDTALAPEQKQTAMVAAVTEVGLDPAKYNAISRAASTDATLRAKVQTAMSKYTGPAPSEG